MRPFVEQSFIAGAKWQAEQYMESQLRLREIAKQLVQDKHNIELSLRGVLPDDISTDRFNQLVDSLTNIHLLSEEIIKIY